MGLRKQPDLPTQRSLDCGLLTVASAAHWLVPDADAHSLLCGHPPMQRPGSIDVHGYRGSRPDSELDRESAGVCQGADYWKQMDDRHVEECAHEFERNQPTFKPETNARIGFERADT